MDQSERAERFHALHRGGEILVLPNAWDAASAAVMEDAGAKAVATSSAALAWAHGYPDGDALPVNLLVSALDCIARGLKAPLTADIEGGYTEDLATLADTIRRVIDAGVVGINLEDGTRDPQLHARKIEAARRAAEAANVPLFINARTDVYLRGLAEGRAAYVEAITRAELYRSAGADGVFIPGPVDEDLIGRLADAVALPLNIMGWTGTPAASRLQALGVRRLSSASGLFRAAYSALQSATQAFLASGDANALARLREHCPDFNARFSQSRS